MALAKKPTIFVSSTCYDLKQIRADLKSFLEDQLGYEVLLSEYASFPLDPNVGTVENCLRAVDERADIFVLIIGCRYGSVMESGQSVTNMEYLRAKAKGVPIYAFVENSILNLLPVWKDNPEGNFQSTVDTPKLFEFVETIRNTDGVWTAGFETAHNITSRLQVQLGYLFGDCLALRQKTIQSQFSKKVIELDGVALQTVLMRPAAWEYKLFGQVLATGLDRLVDQKRNFRFGITLAPAKRIENLNELIDHITLKLSQLQRAVDMLVVIINEILPEAIGAPGVSGDADYIVYSANQILLVYNSIIEWSLDFVSIETNDDFKGIISSFAKICNVTLDDIENFSKEYNEKINSIPDNVLEDCQLTEIQISLVLSSPDIDEINREVELLKRKYRR